MKDRKESTGNGKENKRGRRWCVRELSSHPAYHTKNYHNFEADLFYRNYLPCLLSFKCNTSKRNVTDFVVQSEVS
jgi:hypothetical protein